MQTSLGPHGVRLFKSTNYPPQTAEEKAQWEWWDAMEKTDPDFQWKMPIEFYGKVVDQFGQPVVNAEVVFGAHTLYRRLAFGFPENPDDLLFAVFALSHSSAAFLFAAELSFCHVQFSGVRSPIRTIRSYFDCKSLWEQIQCINIWLMEKWLWEKPRWL